MGRGSRLLHRQEFNLRHHRIIARVQLLPSAESGLSSPIPGGTSYRPNHNFLDAENREMGMGAIDLPSGVALHPGEAIDVEMILYPWPPETDMSPGRTWRIQEGGRLVGTGTVLVVLKSN